MKLTNTMREAFVRAAMDDVPSIDYDTLIRKAALQAALKALPATVRKVYDDEKTRTYLENTFLRFGGVSVYVPGRTNTDISDEDKKSLNELATAKSVQETGRNELRGKLASAATAVTTRKALAELLPEFEKYLPADLGAANRMLPAVANIVADFTKAGWPKGKQPASKKSKAAA